MRETDRIANEQFNGNVEQAIKHIIKNSKKGERYKYIDEWTKEECDMAMQYLAEISVQNLTIDEAIELKKELGENFDLSSEEIARGVKNPYQAKVKKDFLKLLLVNGGILAAGAALQNVVGNVDLSTVTTAISSIFTTTVAVDAGPNLFNYFKFKKNKSKIDVDDVDLDSGGKKL